MNLRRSFAFREQTAPKQLYVSRNADSRRDSGRFRPYNRSNRSPVCSCIDRDFSDIIKIGKSEFRQAYAIGWHRGEGGDNVDGPRSFLSCDACGFMHKKEDKTPPEELALALKYKADFERGYRQNE